MDPDPGALEIRGYYVDVGRVGRVRVIGCPEHVAMLLHDLRSGRLAREARQ